MFYVIPGYFLKSSQCHFFFLTILFRPKPVDISFKIGSKGYISFLEKTRHELTKKKSQLKCYLFYFSESRQILFKITIYNPAQLLLTKFTDLVAMKHVSHKIFELDSNVSNLKSKLRNYD